MLKAKRSAASADYIIMIDGHKSTLKVRGDEFTTCLAAAEAAVKAIRKVFSDEAAAEKLAESVKA